VAETDCAPASTTRTANVNRATELAQHIPFQQSRLFRCDRKRWDYGRSAVLKLPRDQPTFLLSETLKRDAYG